MTKGFATKLLRLAGTAILTGLLVTSAGAQGPAPATPRTVVLFFDMQSDRLTPEAKSIVLSAVDAAERVHAGRIELAAYAAPDETTRDPALAARRAATLKQQIAAYGFHGVVVVDQEATDVRLMGPGEETFDRRAILRVTG